MTLLEMLAQAGGIRSDAGYGIRIIGSWNGLYPFAECPSLTPTGQFTVAELDLKKIMEAKNPEENIQISSA